jgi:hypothetical protein
LVAWFVLFPAISWLSFTAPCRFSSNPLAKRNARRVVWHFAEFGKTARRIYEENRSTPAFAKTARPLLLN